MSDAFDQMKNIKNGNYTTEAHTEETKKIKFKNSEPVEPDGNIIKNFILKWGRYIIDFFAWVDVVIAIVAFAIFMGMFFDSFGKDSQETFTLFLCMIFVPLLILLFTIAANYFIYLLIDIRDLLKVISKK